MKRLILIFLLFIGCAAGPGIKSDRDKNSIIVNINASYLNCYKATSTILTDYNFPLEVIDQTLGIIRTEFIEYKGGSAGFWYDVLAGMEDFRMQINVKIDSLALDTTQIILYGKMKYTKRENIFKDSEKIETIRANTDSFKQMEQIAQEIKELAESKNEEK